MVIANNIHHLWWLDYDKNRKERNKFNIENYKQMQINDYFKNNKSLFKKRNEKDIDRDF